MNEIRRGPRGAIGALVVAAFASACVAACRRAMTPAPGPPARSGESGVSALVPRFRPPADGRITPEELDRYLRVRRGSRGRTDREAARALALDPDEFFWVRGRVLEALVELQAQKVRNAAESVYARTIASLRETRKSVRDPGTARTLDEQIAAMERERATIRKADPVPASVLANARLVAGRRVEVDSVSP